MAHNNLAKTTVIGIPEGVTNGEIRLACCVEPGMGGAPTVTAIDERELLQTRQPLASAAVAQLGIGGVLTQAVLGFQGINEVLLMVPAQPRGMAGLDQSQTRFIVAGMASPRLITSPQKTRWSFGGRVASSWHRG